MELVCHSTASDESKRFLLSDFMHGFLFNLFTEK